MNPFIKWPLLGPLLSIVLGIVLVRHFYFSKPDLSGFWRGQCSDSSGVEIRKIYKNLYSIGFCGVNGNCDSPGEWTPNSAIYGDPKYKVIDANTILFTFKNAAGFVTYHRCKKQEPEKNAIKFVNAEDTIHPEPGVDEELPKLEKNIPFTITNEAFEGLVETINKAESGSIRGGSNHDEKFRLSSNFKKNDLEKIRSYFARKLKLDTRYEYSFWKIKRSTDGPNDLIVGAVFLRTIGTDAAGEVFSDPYSYFWYLKQERDSYTVLSIDHVLKGDIVSTSRMQGRKNTAFYIRSQSCTECHPWIYLAAFALEESRPELMQWKFSYSNEKKKMDYVSELEYELPGLGHSVEAKVETRVIEQSFGTEPRIVQRFYEMDDGGEEWWDFKCVADKCDSVVRKGELPGYLRAAWESGKKL